MPRKRSWRRLRPELIYGFEPEELGGEGDTLVLAEKRAALTAMRAWEARTWGEFAEVAGRSWDELLKDYGDEIKEDCGCLPSPGERFWYGDYLHLDSLRQLIPDPRDEAFFFIWDYEELSRIFKDAGFAFFPKPGGPNVVVFADPAQAERVASATGLSIERDDLLLEASLYRERASGEVMPSHPPGG